MFILLKYVLIIQCMLIIDGILSFLLYNSPFFPRISFFALRSAIPLITQTMFRVWKPNEQNINAKKLKNSILARGFCCSLSLKCYPSSKYPHTRRAVLKYFFVSWFIITGEVFRFCIFFQKCKYVKKIILLTIKALKVEFCNNKTILLRVYVNSVYFNYQYLSLKIAYT